MPWEQLRDKLLVTPHVEPAWNELSRRIRECASAGLRFHSSLKTYDVDDVVSRSILRLLTPGRLLRASSFAYVRVLVQNIILDFLRRSIIESRGLKGLSESARRYQATTSESTKLATILATLTSDDRELIRLKFWEGLKIGEIAKAIGVPYSTVAVRLFRLQATLKRRISPQSASE